MFKVYDHKLTNCNDSLIRLLPIYQIVCRDNNFISLTFYEILYFFHDFKLFYSPFFKKKNKKLLCMPCTLVIK